ncbi:MAG: hypothetical protein ACLQAT_02230 [Candidatus Binataceae bacterium]
MITMNKLVSVAAVMLVGMALSVGYAQAWSGAQNCTGTGISGGSVSTSGGGSEIAICGWNPTTWHGGSPYYLPTLTYLGGGSYDWPVNAHCPYTISPNSGIYSTTINSSGNTTAVTSSNLSSGHNYNCSTDAYACFINDAGSDQVVAVDYSFFMIPAGANQYCVTVPDGFGNSSPNCGLAQGTYAYSGWCGSNVCMVNASPGFGMTAGNVQLVAFNVRENCIY